MGPGARCRLVTSSPPEVSQLRATLPWPPWRPPPHSPTPRPPLSRPRASEATLRPEVTRPQTIITPEVIRRRLTVTGDLPEIAEDRHTTPEVHEVPHMMAGPPHPTMATEAEVEEVMEVPRLAVVPHLNHEARLRHTETLLTAVLRGRGEATMGEDIEVMKRVEQINCIYITCICIMIV